MSTAATTGWVPEDDFAARLLLARKQAGLTVKEAALRCGLHYATWSTWERGRVPANMTEVVSQIAKGLGCDRAWLAWGGQLAPAAGARRPRPTGDVASAQNSPLLRIVTDRIRFPRRCETDRPRRERDALPRPVLALVS